MGFTPLKATRIILSLSLSLSWVAANLNQIGCNPL